MAIKADKNLKIGDELKFKENKIGKKYLLETIILLL